MDYHKEAIATFCGQVKSCRGDKQPQWKSGFVRVCPQPNDGLLSAVMFLNVMPNQVYSQIKTMPTGLSVKSNRVVIDDAKGPGMYIRLSSSREVESARKAISKISAHEPPKRNKAEVGIKSMGTPLKSPSPSVMRQATPAVSWTKIATPKSVTKSCDSNTNNYSNSNGWRSANRLKRQSFEMEDGDIDSLYNDENQDKTTEFTRFRKTSPNSENKDHVSLGNMKANNFYGKSALISPGLHVKTPRSRVRDQAVSSVNKGLYAAGIMSIKEKTTTNGNADEESNKEDYSDLPPLVKPTTEIETQDTFISPIVGFDNLGNTCFINSPLQCLAYLEPLSLDIQAVAQRYGRSLKSGSITKLLYLLMKDVRKTGSSIDPDRVKLILMRLRKIMDGKFAVNTQQDAHELLSEILDRCDEEMKELQKGENGEVGGGGGGGASNMVEHHQDKKEQKNPESPSKSIPNPTVNNFNSYFKNTFQCQTCKNQTASQEEHDTTMMLALTSHPELHLQDCVDNYFKGCEVEMKCEACKQNEKATITRKIVKRPRCLILNLLRYSTDNMDAKKKMDRVNIPRYISISDFCSDDVKPPAHIEPGFLLDRIPSGGFSNFDLASPNPPAPSNQSTNVWPEKEVVVGGADKGLTEEVLCPSPPPPPPSPQPPTYSTTTTDVIATASFTSSADGLDSFNKTVDDDSVFGVSVTSSTTKTSMTTSTVESSWCTSFESVSCERIVKTYDGGDGGKETGEKQDDVVIDTSGNDKNSYCEGEEEDDDDDDDDGVVSFGKIHHPQRRQIAERVKRVKCRGGAEMSSDSNSNGECNDSKIIVVEEAKDTSGDTINGVDVKTSNGHWGGEGSGLNGDADDFVPVGEVQGPVVRCGWKEDEQHVMNTLFPVPRSVRGRHNDVNGQAGGSAASHDYESCLKVNVDHPFQHNIDSIYKPQMNGTNSLDEDGLMETDDMGTHTICGRSVHEYTEDELIRLDIGALTEYEMLLYAQALSSFEYEKEKVVREERERQMLESMTDEFVYDISFLEEAEAAESLIKSSSCSSGGNDNQSTESTSSPLKKFKSGKSDESFVDGGSSSDNSGTTQKVPDIMESVEGDGLICYENLSEDDEINSLKGLSVSSATTSKLDDFGASKERRKKKTTTLGEAGLENGGVASGILSDKNQRKHVTTVTKDDLKEALEVSGTIVSSQKGKSPIRVVNNSPNNSSDSDKEQPLFINQPVQSPSHFQKPTSDLCIISPSKNRNLVKTRDYSRLRSPSASPKKKAVKTSGLSSPSPSSLKKANASKQLRFSDNTKSDNLWGNSGIYSSSVYNRQEKLHNITPEKLTSSCGTQMTPDHNPADKITATTLEKRDIWHTSRALHFGEDEPDSMNFHDNNNNDNIKNNNNNANPFGFTPFHNTHSSSISTHSNYSTSASLFSTVTTSTPIISDTVVSSGRTMISPNLPSSASTTSLSLSANNLKNKMDSSSSRAASENYRELTPEDDVPDSSCDGNGKRSLILPRDSSSGTGSAASTAEKDSLFGPEPKYSACAPFQDGSARRKINRSLTSSFIAAEGKENSVEITQERQARKKRIGNIEQGEAPCSYRLVGIVNHHGESLFAGHYTSSSYNLSKQCWFRMDDKNTSESSELTARKESSTTGYIFFYMDKDLFESYAREKVRSGSSNRKSSTSPS